MQLLKTISDGKAFCLGSTIVTRKKLVYSNAMRGISGNSLQYLTVSYSAIFKTTTKFTSFNALFTLKKSN